MADVKNRRLAVANWKMNPSNLAQSLKLFNVFKKVSAKATFVQVVVCAPYIYIPALLAETNSNRLLIGAQDASSEKVGPYTGEVSASQLGTLGVNSVIIGHSERRAMGESNELIARKVDSVLKEGMRAILCVGESTRDTEGVFLNFVKQQLEECLANVPRRYFLNLIIAYEPLWAISTHATATETPDDMLQMSIFIRKTLGAICGKDIAVKIPILYGGSVTDLTASAYLSEGGADGVLVGKASLSAESFSEIIKSINALKVN